MGKYIIDIEEGKEGVIFSQKGIVAVGLHLNDENSLKPLGIKSAIPYIEPSRGEIYKNAYQKGYEIAKHECEDCNVNAVKIVDDKAHEAYQKGLEDAWEAAKKIVLSTEDGGLFDYDVRKSVFGCGNYMALKTFLAPEAIEKIRQYEQEQEEIKVKVGDEVQHRKHSGIKVIVLNKDGDAITAIAITNVPFACKVGDMYINRNVKDWEKTGKHYEIAEVLKKMREKES